MCTAGVGSLTMLPVLTMHRFMRLNRGGFQQLLNGVDRKIVPQALPIIMGFADTV